MGAPGLHLSHRTAAAKTKSSSSFEPSASSSVVVVAVVMVFVLVGAAIVTRIIVPSKELWFGGTATRSEKAIASQQLAQMLLTHSYSTFAPNKNTNTSATASAVLKYVDAQATHHRALYQPGEKLAALKPEYQPQQSLTEQNSQLPPQQQQQQVVPKTESPFVSSPSNPFSHRSTVAPSSPKKQERSPQNIPKTNQAQSKANAVDANLPSSRFQLQQSSGAPFVMPATPQTLSPNLMTKTSFGLEIGSSGLGRASPSAAFWGSELAILGGVGDFSDLNIWTFAPSKAPSESAWTDWPILKSAPLICCGGQISGVQVDPSNSKSNWVFWFGGSGLDSSYPDSMYAYNFSSYSWVEFAPPVHPSGRAYYCMVTIPSLDGNPKHTDVLISSGFDSLQQVSDTWVFNTWNNTWKQLNTKNSDIARRSHMGCDFDSSRNILIMFGGQTDDNFLNDLVYLNLTSLTWVSPVTTGYQVPAPAGAVNMAVANGAVYTGRFQPAQSNTPPWREMAKLDLKTWVWSYYEIPTSVDFKNEEYWVTNSDATGFLLVGGQLADGNANHPTNEIWEFIPARNPPWVLLWKNELSARPLAGHSIDLLGDALVVFGGFQSAPATASEDVQPQGSLYFVPLRNDPGYHLQWFPIPITGVVPSPRGWHSTCLIGNQLYLFGGATTHVTGDELGDFYTVNLGDLSDLAAPLSRVWVQLSNPSTATAALPAARAGASLLYLNELIWLVGGANTVRNGQTDVWNYDIDLDLWTHVGTDADVTGNPNTVNFGYVQCVNDDRYIYCVGGCDTATCYDQLNIFDTQSKQWYVFYPPPGQDFQSFGHHSMERLGDLAIIVNGGMGRELLVTERFLVFSLSAHRQVIEATPSGKFTNGTFVRRMIYVDQRPQPSRDEQAWLFGNRFFIHGGWGSIPFFNESQRNLVEFAQTETTYVQNIVYSALLTPLCPLGKGNVQSANSSTCFPCGPGTYYNSTSKTCNYCLPGTYQDLEGASSCKLCPRGFYGTWPGAQSLSLCTPCPEQTFGPNSGATSCISCNSSYFCPISTIVPAPAADGVEALVSGGVLDTRQPQVQENQSLWVARVQITLYSLIGLIALGIAGLFIATFVSPKMAPYSKVWKKLNLFFKKDHQHFDPIMDKKVELEPTAEDVRAILRAKPLPPQVHARSDRASGMLSAIFALFAVVFAFIILLPYSNQRFLETRFMVMNALLSPSQKLAVKANISFSMDLVGYSGWCIDPSKVKLAGGGALDASAVDNPLMPVNFTTALSSGDTTCHPQILMSSDFYNQPSVVQCRRSVVSSFPTCSVTWTCLGCTMETLANTIAFRSQEHLAFAHWIQYVFQSTSGYPDPSQITFISGVLSPLLGKSFRGPDPSSLSFSTSSSVYVFPLAGYEGGGYISEFATAEAGSQVGSEEFELVSELQVRIHLTKAESAIFTMKSEVETLEHVIAGVLGSVSGFLGAFGAILVFMEKFGWWSRLGWPWMAKNFLLPSEAADKADEEKQTKARGNTDGGYQVQKLEPEAVSARSVRDVNATKPIVQSWMSSSNIKDQDKDKSSQVEMTRTTDDATMPKVSKTMPGDRSHASGETPTMFAGDDGRQRPLSSDSSRSRRSISTSRKSSSRSRGADGVLEGDNPTMAGAGDGNNNDCNVNVNVNVNLNAKAKKKPSSKARIKGQPRAQGPTNILQTLYDPAPAPSLSPLEMETALMHVFDPANTNAAFAPTISSPTTNRSLVEIDNQDRNASRRDEEPVNVISASTASVISAPVSIPLPAPVSPQPLYHQGNVNQSSAFVRLPGSNEIEGDVDVGRGEAVTIATTTKAKDCW